MTKRRLGVLAAMTLTTATLALVGGGPATAGNSDPAGGECTIGLKDSHPNSSSIKFIVKTTCNRGYYEIYNGLTVERDGKAVGTDSLQCSYPQDKGSCSVTTKAYDDPKGQQSWEIYDQYRHVYTYYDGAADANTTILYDYS